MQPAKKPEKYSSFIARMIILLTLTTGCCAAILILSLRSMPGPEPFLRQIKNELIVPVDSFVLPKPTLYIAGFERDTIFLGDQEHNQSLIRIAAASKRIDVVLIKAVMPFTGLTKIAVDSVTLYAMEYIGAHMFSGDAGKTMVHELNRARHPFVDIVPISTSQYATRILAGKKREYILSIENPGGQTIQNDSILQKQIDGLFCVDGMLLYNKKHHQLIYVYYYRNQFICSDTNLQRVRRFNTLDTNSRAKMTIGSIRSKGVMTLTSPFRVVNLKSCTSGDYLFVNSNIIGIGEGPFSFKTYFIVDVYEIRNGKYQFSFYLQNREGHKPIEFRVFNSVMLVQYDKMMIEYQLRNVSAITSAR